MSDVILALTAFFCLATGCAKNESEIQSACVIELSEVDVAESITVSIEMFSEGILHKIGSDPYWKGIPSIETSCDTPSSLPDLDPQFFDEEFTAPKPVMRVGLDNYSGIIFVYSSVGDGGAGEGMSAALVEYHNDGRPLSAYKVAEVLRDESGGKVVTSNLDASSIKRCFRRVDFGIYDDSGNIIGDLDNPLLGVELCETVVNRYP